MTVASSSAQFRRRLTQTGTALAVATLTAALSSCSGDAGSPPAGGGTSAAEQPQASASSPAAGADQSSQPASTLTATEVDFAIELSETELTAGSYTVEVSNEGAGSHDLVIEDADGTEVAASEVMPPGRSGTVEVDLEPGEYVFYCSVGNHRSMGMELTVTVV